MSSSGTVDGIDTIYTTAREMLRWSGEAEELQPMQQILLRDGRFYGYLFDGEGVCVIWTVENQKFTVRQREQGNFERRNPKTEDTQPETPALKVLADEGRKRGSSKTKEGKRRRKSA